MKSYLEWKMLNSLHILARCFKGLDRVEKEVYQNRIEKRFATDIVLASYRLLHSISVSSPVSAIYLQ